MLFQMDDTVQLTIAVLDPDPGISPNLTSLEKDFDMLGTVQRTQTSIMNGQTTTTTEWVTTLAPKRIGNLVIPPIQMGAHHTVPITLTSSFLNNRLVSQQRPIETFFLKRRLNQRTPISKAKVLYTVQGHVLWRLQYLALMKHGLEEADGIPDVTG